MKNYQCGNNQYKKGYNRNWRQPIYTKTGKIAKIGLNHKLIRTKTDLNITYSKPNL